MAFQIQNFCERCGARLTEGSVFCENCGTRIISENEESQNDSIQQPQSETSSEDLDHGIIYTDTAKIAATMGVSESEVQEILDDYIASSRSRGVEYLLCTAADSQNVKEHIEKIKSETKSKTARFVFIIGSWDVVPQKIWDNPANDGDETVPSDLPYSVLSEKDPASGVKFDFETALCVGRLPVYEGESIECFKAYFENVKNYSGKLSSPVTFGETAKQWVATSKVVYKPFKNGDLVCSPNVTYEDVEDEIPENANLLFFNVHGSDQAKYWYGQEDWDYPEAFSPENMRGLSTRNFVGVEACYGARYNGFSSDESVVEAALESKCLGLFGSSKIAFGVPGNDDESVCCADIIVGEFLNNIKDGMMSGDAAALARKVFWEQAEDDCDMKTIMEFDLYGDPTARMSLLSEKKKAFVATSRKKGIAAQKSGVPSLNIVMPDINRAIRSSLSRTSEKINEQVNRFVWDKFSEVKDIAPKTYSVNCGFKSMLKNVYTAKSQSKGGFDSSIITYYEPSGKILKVLGTK